MRQSSRQSGQAAAEYVGLLAILATALVAATTGVAAPDLPGAAVRVIRTGLCLVGGDVCRSADAAARGLDPCVTAMRERARETGVTVAVVRVGEGKGYAVGLRSDDSVVIRATDDSSLQLTGGFGTVGSAAVGPAFRRGREWTFPDAAAARRFLDRIPDPFDLTDDGDVGYYGAPRAPVRYLEGGGAAAAALEAELGGPRAGIVVPGIRGDVRAALGRRRDPAGTSVYYTLEGATGGALTDLLAGLRRRVRWVAEWRRADPPVLTLRGTSTDGGGTTTEHTARLVLADPEDRRRAQAFVLIPLSPAPLAFATRDLLDRVRARGTIERHTYREEREERSVDVTARLVGSGGVDHATSVVRRRLVAAEVLQRGRRGWRLDCVGLRARSGVGATATSDP